MHNGSGDCVKDDKPKIFDGSICFKMFVAAMGTILGELELAKALWRFIATFLSRIDSSFQRIWQEKRR